MTSSQVECFFAAAEYKSFTKAAQHLYMTTAAVSKNVQALEHELGVTLFWRGRTLTLTPSGTILLETMKRSRISFSHALQEARSLTKELTGSLSTAAAGPRAFGYGTRLTAIGAERLTYSRVKQSEIVVDLGNGTYR